MIKYSADENEIHYTLLIELNLIPLIFNIPGQAFKISYLSFSRSPSILFSQLEDLISTHIQNYYT